LKTGLRKVGPGLKKALSDELAKAKGTRVVVGVLGKTSPRPGDAIDNAALALIQEFGLGVPERSFLRAPFDRHHKEWEELADRLLKGVSRGKLELDHALGLLGERMKADVKKWITDHQVTPPSSTPGGTALVDTGRLLGSIDYEVRRPK
jgi:hypothetical protein